MPKNLLLSLPLLFFVAGGSINKKSLPRYNYLDSLQTKKTVSCRDQVPLHCMACTLQGEAANQSSQGAYAVGMTIMTRAKGNLRKICSVVRSPKQFELSLIHI